MNLSQEKVFIILIGRSGSGKGAQASLLLDYFNNTYRQSGANYAIEHYTTGGNFRDFIKESNYSAEISEDIISQGGLMPEFLATWNWSDIFIKNIKSNTSVILDGAPRRVEEISDLDSALTFYKFKNKIVIYIDLPESIARDRLASRGRADDISKDNIDKKMRWFEEYVLPCVDHYKNVDSRYKFLHIDGRKSIESIHTDIIKKLHE